MYYQSLGQSVNTGFEAAHKDIRIIWEIIKVKKDGYAELQSRSVHHDNSPRITWSIEQNRVPKHNKLAANGKGR